MYSLQPVKVSVPGAASFAASPTVRGVGSRWNDITSGTGPRRCGSR
jgi:hypothetical protein